MGPVLWKGKTFSQVTSTMIRNNASPPNDDAIYHPLPWKHYRKEIHLAHSSTHSSFHAMLDFETPGGTIVTQETSDVCTPYSTTIDTLVPKCVPIVANTSQKYLQNLSPQNDARRRVRSSGMVRPRYKPEQNNAPEYHVNAEQYLRSRNKTFQQNQFHSLRSGNSDAVPGTIEASKNTYASNSNQYCGTNFKTDYVPVYYKPNNSTFATQGAVDSSLRLERLKLLTAQRNGDKKDVPLINSRYTLKDKIGYPNTCTPIFSPVNLQRSTVC
jgi:hypothetical protein